MADFAINVILRSRNEASPAIRQVMGDAQRLRRMGERETRGRGGRAGKKKGFFDLNAAGIHETSAALTQLGGAAKMAVGTPIELAANFEAAINKVNALSGGALSTEMAGDITKLQAISNKSRELGKSTEFTATEVAEGFQILTQAGFGYEQQLASIGTTLNLATAAQVSMDKAAELTANTIGGFGLKAEDAVRIGDVMARASNASQISIQNLGDSFKYAAPGAKVLGVSLEETATAVAILGKAGRFGGQGGTDLRAFMNRLAMLSNKKFSTKKQNLAAKMLGLDRDALKKVVETGDLQKIARFMGESIAKSGLSSTQKTAALQAIFQERGATAANILMASAMDESADGWQGMEEKVNDANITLEKSASIIRSGTKGSITVLKSALEELGITVGEKLLPVITPLIMQATDAAYQFAEWANKNPGLVRGIGKVLIVSAALGTTLGPLFLTLASIKTVLGALRFLAPLVGKGFGAMGAGAGKAGSALGKFRLAGAAVAVGMIAAAATVAHLEGKIARLRAQTRELGSQVASNEAGLAAELSDEELAAREERLLGLSETERARADAKQQELDDEWGGSKSFILGAFGGSELNTADDSAADMLEQQYQTVRDERIRRQKEKAETLAAKAAPTLGEAKAGKPQVLIDPEARVRITIQDGRAPKVEELESGDIPLEVETGIVGGESY